jgi:hypothetical protein
VETILIHAGNIFVAGITTYLRRVVNQIYMSEFFVSDTTITAVADNTANLAMRALHEFSTSQEDLLPYFQRR